MLLLAGNTIEAVVEQQVPLDFVDWQGPGFIVHVDESTLHAFQGLNLVRGACRRVEGIDRVCSGCMVGVRDGACLGFREYSVQKAMQMWGLRVPRPWAGG